MEVVYFEFNNWFSGRDYPLGAKYDIIINTNRLSEEKFVRDNKLVVVCGPIDMSMNWCVTAPREWVEKVFPELLTDESYTYDVQIYRAGKNEIVQEHRSYSDFLKYPDEDGNVPTGHWGMPFYPYTEENIGVHWVDVDWPEYNDDEDEEGEED